MAGRARILKCCGWFSRSPLGETLGREAMHFNLETAVARYNEISGRGAL